jgi:hypothetical protein
MSETTATDKIKLLRVRIYEKQQEVTGLTRLVYDYGRKDRRGDLLTAQDELAALRAEALREEAEAAKKEQEAKSVAEAERQTRGVTRSMSTTGVQVTVISRMEYVPTAYYHLFTENDSPLIECRLEARSNRRLRITAEIEHYSAKAISTVELNPRTSLTTSVSLLPTLFPNRVHELRELTRASVNVLVEDLSTLRVEEHLTHPIWLLSCNSATFEVQDLYSTDPGTRVKDFYPYLGAFVTPNHPCVQRYLRQAAEYHGTKQLSGAREDATGHAAAIYAALQKVTDMVYVNSTLAFNPMQGSIGQRVRLPHECLEEKLANCLDGVLLFASLLEAAGQEAAVVLLPNHAVVGWRTGPGAEDWAYLETTMIRTEEFDKAKTEGTELALLYAGRQKKREEAPAPEGQQPGQPGKQFRRLELRDLRGAGIMPLA